MDNFIAHQRKTNTKPEIAFLNRFPLNAMVHILILMKLSIAPIQIIFKRNNGHFVAFLCHNHITQILLKVEFLTENANF